LLRGELRAAAPNPALLPRGVEARPGALAQHGAFELGERANNLHHHSFGGRGGIFSYCINLDRKADDYVGDIFGRRYTVIDDIERLPERLPELFMALTR